MDFTAGRSRLSDNDDAVNRASIASHRLVAFLETMFQDVGIDYWLAGTATEAVRVGRILHGSTRGTGIASSVK